MKPDTPRVLILHQSPPADGATAWRESDAGVVGEVRAVENALASLGLACRTVGVSRLCEVPAALASAPEEVVFNLVEGFAESAADACSIPALCRAFGKACTGSDTPCLALTLDKWQTKAVFQAAGLVCPPGILVEIGAAVRVADLPPGPYIVKPVSADASEGIDSASVVASRGRALSAAVRRVHDRLRQAALVEQFIAGRELFVSCMEGRDGGPEILPIAEIDFSAFPPDLPRIVDYAAKWLPNSFEYGHTPNIIPSPLTAGQMRLIRDQTLTAWRVTGCRGYARVDFRLSVQGRPYILEVNANPDVSPEAGFAAALTAAKVPFTKFVEACVRDAINRRGAVASSGRPCRKRAKKGPGPFFTIRQSQPRDRDTILAFMAATGFFRPDEMLIAQEVLDESLAKGPGGPYQSFVADEGGRPVGWVCIGPTPCTLGTFDIYWIGVSPDRQGGGVGAGLMAHVEDLIVRQGGRLAVVETSGRAVYDPTRSFYSKLGYHEAARVADFYAPGDDKVICVKPLAPAR